VINKIFIGALTDKLYAFSGRMWELNVNNTIDIYDSLGSNIKIYISGAEVKRVLPLKNDFINEEWISNKTRYFFEGLTKWRINIPLMKKNDIMVYISWIQAFYYFLLKVWFSSFFNKSSNLIFINSLFVDYELIVTSKILIKKLGFLSFDKKLNININDYYLYYLNPNFFEQINNKKIFLFLGYNLRLESPILNIKLRKKSLKENVLYFTIGSNFNDNLNSVMLGLNINTLIKYLQGKLKICNLILKNVKKLNNEIFNISTLLNLNMFLIGNNILNRVDNKNIFRIIEKYNNNNILLYKNYSKNYSNYLSFFFFNFCINNLHYSYFKKGFNLGKNINILHVNLTSILYEELNLHKNINNIEILSKNDIFYLLGIDFLKLKDSIFSVFQGHHINLDYLKVDLIFPSITFLEKSSNFLSIEGNLLQTNFILYPPVFCRNDWSILNALYIYILNFVVNLYNLDLKKKINYLNVNRFYILISDFKKISFLIKNLSMNFYFKEISKYNIYTYNMNLNININFISVSKIYNTIINNKNYNPYKLDIISQNSSILKACTLYFDNLFRNYQNIEIFYKKKTLKKWN
jgi:NADH dehydrogenase/NADH:ubiquinone oxidoreductase subunit G